MADVTTAWRVVRLWMKVITTRYEGELRSRTADKEWISHLRRRTKS